MPRKNVSDLIQREITGRISDSARRIALLETLEPGGAFVSLTGAQSIAGVKTFSDGISFGNETLEHYNEDTWTPVITGSGSNPTVSYTEQVGRFTQNGNKRDFNFRIQINTISGGSGNIRISLPSALPSGNVNIMRATISFSGVDLTGTPANVIFAAQPGVAYGHVQSNADDAAATVEQISALAAGDVIGATGFYFTN